MRLTSAFLALSLVAAPVSAQEKCDLFLLDCEIDQPLVKPENSENWKTEKNIENCVVGLPDSMDDPECGAILNPDAPSRLGPWMVPKPPL